ncbi:hypothetical protein [Actinocatenispora comari]|uniref:Uncharacterized protein n=1 Tax=Actinocatenispora comari TaxID=2807577 RepID=A0A8J4EHN2_9ACTN|nr:hypothetical protein [Actinocatenispora comari]GIL25192.1 hypothetical protein NUM_04470 [Actinocatenispora comari]
MEPAEYDGDRLLAPLRDLPTPPTHVDVADAVRIGRRRARARTRLLTGATALVVILTLVVSFGTTGLDRLLPGPERPAAAGGTFDPLRRAVTVGAAGGFVPVSYETGRYWQRVVLRRADDADPRPSDPVASVTVYPKGRLPQVDGARWHPGGRRAGAAVPGRTGYWVAPPVVAAGATGLAWRLPTGEWAVGQVNRTGAAWRDRLAKVALSVRPGGGQVRLPLTIPRRVADVLGRLHGTLTTVGPDTSRGVYALVLRPASADQETTDGSADVVVGVQRDADRGPLLGDPWPGVDLAALSGLTTGAVSAVLDSTASGFTVVATRSRGRLDVATGTSGAGSTPSPSPSSPSGSSGSTPIPSGGAPSPSSGSTGDTPDASSASPSPSYSAGTPQAAGAQDLARLVTSIRLVGADRDETHWATRPLT